MTACSLKDSNLQPNLSRLVGLERKSLLAQELERSLSVEESRTAPETRTDNSNASVTRAPATVYRVEHRVYGVGPFDRDGFCGQRFQYLEMMRAVDAKSAFLSPWALLCYFGSTLPIAACYGYLAALYVAPVLKEDHTGQCLIPVDAQPLRRVPLLDLALLAGEGG